MATLTRVAFRRPQTIYAGLKKSFHQEWAFVQCVTPYIGVAFQVVEDALRDIFLPSLFQEFTTYIPGREITSLMVEQVKIALPNPTWTAGANWMSSCVITGHLIAALHGTAKFRSGDHALLIG